MPALWAPGGRPSGPWLGHLRCRLGRGGPEVPASQAGRVAILAGPTRVPVVYPSCGPPQTEHRWPWLLAPPAGPCHQTRTQTDAFHRPGLPPSAWLPRLPWSVCRDRLCVPSGTDAHAHTHTHTHTRPAGSSRTCPAGTDPPSLWPFGDPPHAQWQTEQGDRTAR